MKRCAKCDQTYADDTLNYCLADGTMLVNTGEEPTVVTERPTITAAQPAKKGKGKLLLVLGVIVLTVFVVCAMLLAWLLFRSGKPSGSTANDRAINTTKTQTPTPKPTVKPTAAPTSTVSEPTPEKDGTPDDGDEEVTPIAWDTSAMGFNGENGRTYTFECPKNGYPVTIYGSDVYTDYSSICTAAVHAGLFSIEDGGTVTIEYRPGKPVYGSTDRHGIKSNTAGQYSRSFIVR